MWDAHAWSTVFPESEVSRLMEASHLGSLSLIGVFANRDDISVQVIFFGDEDPYAIKDFSDD